MIVADARLSGPQARMAEHDDAVMAARYLAWLGVGEWGWDDDACVWRSTADANGWCVARPVFECSSFLLIKNAEAYEGRDRLDLWLRCGAHTPERYSDGFLS